MDRYTTEIIANDMQMLDKKGEIDGSFAAAAPLQQKQTMAAPPAASAESFAGAQEDDIPF